ncbi:hypothetical protein CYMTET_7460 [Cymbomonas tetramitiformis]|uniref:Uncharacterized protein n=1 Tax=Cymbomonas tetramitiformis TaxID=36881 RepID=A0AAE0GVF7_9CHLO|nr:hypothetical protein CYMTET_7460 [Cymbomonas tetramitiformis]|eukprot:gene203-363_t
MDFIKDVCTEASFVYDPVTAIEEGRLSFSIGSRTKKIGKKETKQEFYPIAHYTPAPDDESHDAPQTIILEEPEIAYGNTTNTLKAWKSEVYRNSDGTSNEAAVAARKMTFFSESKVVQREFGMLYEEMYVKPVANYWHVTSPKDFCNRALTMLEYNGTVVQDEHRNDAEALKALLSDKQREMLTNSVMSYIKSSAYSFERTESTGKLDATYVRCKGTEMGITATLPVTMGYDDKKRKFECRDPVTNILNFGKLEMHSILCENPLQLEVHEGQQLHNSLIHGGRDSNNACLKIEDVRPDKYACVVLKHGPFYFKTETSFAPQKHIRWVVRDSSSLSVSGNGGSKVSAIISRLGHEVRQNKDAVDSIEADESFE